MSVIGLESKKYACYCIIKVKEAQVKWYLKESSSPLSGEKEIARVRERDVARIKVKLNARQSESVVDCIFSVQFSEI